MSSEDDIRALKNQAASSMKGRSHPASRMSQRAVWLRAAIPVIILAAVSSCGGTSEPSPRAAARVAFANDEQIGWLHGPCLAISNPNLARGTPVALVITGEPQTVGQARIKEHTESPKTCQALSQGRATMNAKAGVSFYVLEAASVGSTDMGFGIVAPPHSPTVVNGLARVDLDQDGRSEVFSSCATSEGIKFAVWSEKAYQGEPRWSKYYYLDYDTKPTCP